MINLFLRVATLCIFLASGNAFATPFESKKETPQAKQAQTQTININTANLDALQSLPRVGPVIAQRILDYREKNGKFSSKEDLKKVSGIGEKTFARLKDLITI